MGWIGIGYLLGPTLRAPYGANKKEHQEEAIDVERENPIGQTGGLYGRKLLLLSIVVNCATVFLSSNWLKLQMILI